MSLTETQHKSLRGRGHSLKPVVTISERGLTKGVLAELESALGHHKLIKMYVKAAHRERSDVLLQRPAKQIDAMLIQTTGNVSLLYPQHKNKRSNYLSPHNQE